MAMSKSNAPYTPDPRYFRVCYCENSSGHACHCVDDFFHLEACKRQPFDTTTNEGPYTPEDAAERERIEADAEAWYESAFTMDAKARGLLSNPATFGRQFFKADIIHAFKAGAKRNADALEKAGRAITRLQAEPSDALADAIHYELWGDDNPQDDWPQRHDILAALKAAWRANNGC
jgi:hypothetical protein